MYSVIGHVTDLKDVVVTQMALGKAHAVALTNKGQVFTFGINNKGQCGREYHVNSVKEGMLCFYFIFSFACLNKSGSSDN